MRPVEQAKGKTKPLFCRLRTHSGISGTASTSSCLPFSKRYSGGSSSKASAKRTSTNGTLSSMPCAMENKSLSRKSWLRK
jgi:hypothetical protein